MEGAAPSGSRKGLPTVPEKGSIQPPASSPHPKDLDSFVGIQGPRVCIWKQHLGDFGDKSLGSHYESLVQKKKQGLP